MEHCTECEKTMMLLRTENDALRKQRAELLEALKAAQKKGSRWHPADPVVLQIKAAITKAEAAE